MKKIMFNEKYGLNAAVIELLKNMTRRMIPQKTVDFILNDFRREYFEATLDRLDDKECIEQYFLVEKIKEPPYKVGEIVAIAQAYKDIIARISPRFSPHAYDWMREEKGWTNKMFVRADLMPRHIRITDIKVERLHDISDEDCLKEGILKKSDFPKKKSFPYYFAGGKHEWDNSFSTPRKAFAALIDRISGKGTWERNPWVFAYSFELID